MFEGSPYQRRDSCRQELGGGGGVGVVRGGVLGVGVGPEVGPGLDLGQLSIGDKENSEDKEIVITNGHFANFLCKFSSKFIHACKYLLIRGVCKLATNRGTF